MQRDTQGGRPGPARSLSLEKVVGAAMQVLRADGLDAVSFRNVSRRLGVNPMALYTYVDSKEGLLAAMFDQLTRSLDLEVLEADLPADERVVEYYVAAWRMFTEYADLFRLVRPAAAPGVDWAVLEHLFGLFAELGLDAAGALRCQLVLQQLAVGAALVWAQVRAVPAVDPALVDVREHPLVGRTLAELPRLDPEEQVRTALRLTLAAHTSAG